MEEWHTSGKRQYVLWSASFIPQVDVEVTGKLVMGIYEQGLSAVKLAVEAL